MDYYPAYLGRLFDKLSEATGLEISPELTFFLWGVILFTGIAVLAQAAVIFMVLMERKLLAWVTQRKGPNRVGPWGLLQTLADGVKLLFKEDIMTAGQDKLLFTLAPAIFFLPTFVLYALLPFTENLFAAPVAAGALFIFALSSISVIGMVLAGWASNNKYSLLGGMRSAAQAISYEIPLVLAVLSVVLFHGSMNLHDIIEAQNAPFTFMGSDGQPVTIPLGFLKWNFLFLTPVAFLIFVTSAIAEVNRIPFDLPEAESELVSGYNTEYSGMKFALFFLAEYAALFAMCALTVVFFCGGYYSPLGGLLVDQFLPASLQSSQVFPLFREFEMIFWGLSKTYIFIFIAMWIRGTLPRLKPDELMGFSWKFLIPLSLINIFLVAFQRMWMDTVWQDLTFAIAWGVVLVAGIGGFCMLSSKILNDKLNARLARS